MEDQIRDSLTGLYDIQGFREKAFGVMSVLTEQCKECVEAYVFFDVADFKEYNESHGFEGGNLILKTFAELLEKAFPERIVARFSGDHFAALLFKDEVEEGMQRLETLMRENRTTFDVHFRAGVYYCADRYMDSAICIDRAKIAADSIRGEVDVFRVYDEELDQQIQKERYVVEHIDEAILKGYIKVYYQPVIRSLTGKLCGMEALARWDDPQYGLLSPGFFIPVLERTSLIYKLDSYMVQKVCHDLRSWLDAGQTVVPVSFNLTRIDFELCDVISVIEDAVGLNHIQKSYLHVEITESTLNSNENLIAEQINVFHEKGYEVWMDDFGSGYSSLNVLKDYDFNLLKIDMKFLRNFNEKSRSVISSVVHMAKELGIHTLAEGVETAEHAAFLHQIGCERQQGFYYSKPVPTTLDTLQMYEREWGIEEPALREYYDRLGIVNEHKINWNQYRDKGFVQDINSSPVAAFEFDGEEYRFLVASDSFKKAIQGFGIPSIESVEENVNKGSSAIDRRLRTFFEHIGKSSNPEDIYWFDVDFNKRRGNLRVRKSIECRGRIAYDCMLEDLSGSEAYIRREQKDAAVDHLIELFDRVDMIDLEDRSLLNIHARITYAGLSAKMTIDNIVPEFAKYFIHEKDRGRYLALVSLDTIENRIKDTNQGFLTSYFRTREPDGRYVWMEYFYINVNNFDHRILECVRYVSQEMSEALYDYYEKMDEIHESSPEQSENTIHRSELWDAFVADRDIYFFWKDENRRFVGASQGFLDYYGFSSIREIEGKNDEEVGWHVSEEPYRTDEEEILSTGKVTHMVPGQCIARGNLRDIAASKRPIYRDGKIVGLFGYFVDVTREDEKNRNLVQEGLKDHLTGMLSVRGFWQVFPEYEKSYHMKRADFALYCVDIQDFSRFNKNYGVEFGDNVLRATSAKIREVMAVQGVVCRYGGDVFFALKQFENKEEVEKLREEIKKGIYSIHEVNGTPITIFADVGVSYYSESLNMDTMISNAENTLLKNIEEQK